MGSDVPPERFQPMRSVYLSLAVDSSKEAERVHALLAEGGEIFMPMEENLLCFPLQHAARQVRHVVDDSAPEADARELIGKSATYWLRNGIGLAFMHQVDNGLVEAVAHIEPVAGSNDIADDDVDA